MARNGWFAAPFPRISHVQFPGDSFWDVTFSTLGLSGCAGVPFALVNALPLSGVRSVWSRSVRSALGPNHATIVVMATAPGRTSMGNVAGSPGGATYWHVSGTCGSGQTPALAVSEPLYCVRRGMRGVGARE